MSNNVQDMLSALAEAHEAWKLQPELQSHIADLESIGKSNADRINAQEAIISARDTTILELNARIRSLEVERDNAMFRELETADKLDHAMGLVDAFIGKAKDFKAAIEPVPTPEPVEPSTPVVAAGPTSETESTNAEGATSEPVSEPAPEAESIRPTTVDSVRQSSGQSSIERSTSLEGEGIYNPLPQSPSTDSPTQHGDTAASGDSQRELNYDDYIALLADRHWSYSVNGWVYTPRVA